MRTRLRPRHRRALLAALPPLAAELSDGRLVALAAEVLVDVRAGHHVEVALGGDVAAFGAAAACPTCERRAEVEAAAGPAYRALDDERYDEADAAIRALEGRYGSDEPEVTRLRALWHFETVPLEPEPDPLAEVREALGAPACAAPEALAALARALRAEVDALRAAGSTGPAAA